MTPEEQDEVQGQVYLIFERAMFEAYTAGASRKQVHSTMLASVLKELVELQVPITQVLLWCQRAITQVYNEAEKPHAH